MPLISYAGSLMQTLPRASSQQIRHSKADVNFFSDRSIAIVCFLLPLPLGEGWGEGLSADTYVDLMSSWVNITDDNNATKLRSFTGPFNQDTSLFPLILSLFDSESAHCRTAILANPARSCTRHALDLDAITRWVRVPSHRIQQLTWHRYNRSQRYSLQTGVVV
jgi:hypothetical protein